MPNGVTKKKEGIDETKAFSLLRKAYPLEEKGGAKEVAVALYGLYKEGDIAFAKEIMQYVTRIDWSNKKHDFIYRVEKSMKELNDPEFTKLIESVKRERRGAIPVDNGELLIKYSDKTKKSVTISVSLWGNIMVERLPEKNSWRIRSHTDSSATPYEVKTGATPSCTCADFKYRKNKVGGKCKHIHEAEAVEAVLRMAAEE
ncbi:MAG: hypothetical protein M1544_00455 [Candidatus Marsarchaeota archaeon]|nr:hypothetical protein [Candidatus Marsarchaeota archaeon]